jgi:signal transduction histidine kinase
MRKFVLHFSFFSSLAVSAFAETVKVADCERDPSLDYWSAADHEFCTAIMAGVFEAAGVEAERLEFGDDHLMDTEKADVVCSAFRTQKLLEDFDFPLQPLDRMHFALYATPSRAMELMSTKITEWPRMRIGYSPVSQGQVSNDDMVRYFEHARLSPTYVEIPTSAGAVQDLHDGKIDALFLYTPFGKRPEGVVEVVPIGSRNVYFAVTKRKPQLLRKLARAYRTCYIDRIDMYDALRERLLGIPKPQKRVRVAAYSRGDLFEVTPDGARSGALEVWLKSVVGHTHWNVDYVYGDYDESIADVMSGRLDVIGGIGFAASRRDKFRYPHTPMGMLRVYLWARPDSPCQPGEPDTWHGMRVGLLAGTISSQRAKRQLEGDATISCVEFSSDRDMLAAYFRGDIDACVDVEMPDLKDEKALHLYASHPMYICTSLQRKDLFEELESAMDEICDDFPKFLRMISEHHYGRRSDMAALSLEESSWLSRRVAEGRPVVIDFSPWPFPIVDAKGEPTGFVADFLAKLRARTRLRFAVAPQTDISSAEAKFLRGDTDLWIPYPVKESSATYGSTSVFAIPVPQSVAQEMGAEDQYQEFEMFARPNVPRELVSILHKVMTGIDQTQLQEMFMADAAERQVVHRVFGLTREELKRRLVEVSAVILFLVALYGAVMGVLLKKQIRRANRAAEEAEEHARAKTRFLAMMSHELRTPLNAVIGFAEFLAREGLDEKLRHEYTEGILLSSNALLELINDVLDLAKLDAGAMDMRAGECDIGQLLKELPAIFGYRVRRHGVKLRIDAEGDIPVMRLYQQGMRQVLINLVGNAAKFTEKGEIVVSARWIAETKTLHVEVSDTGSGISDEKMKRLFDPYVQDIAARMKSQSGETKGTGLGLPIVKRMVESAGGEISARSEVGRGTTFVIDIPGLETVEVAHTAAQSASETMEAVLPGRVLVVDDMAMNRKILGIHLSNLGIPDIRYAENGARALKVMEEWVPDVVLTDMWMPEMDGTQLAEAMRRDRRLAEVPVAAVTADVDVGSTYDLSLFAKVMSKPVTGEKLRALFGRK